MFHLCFASKANSTGSALTEHVCVINDNWFHESLIAPKQWIMIRVHFFFTIHQTIYEHDFFSES